MAMHPPHCAVGSNDAVQVDLVMMKWTGSVHPEVMPRAYSIAQPLRHEELEHCWSLVSNLLIICRYRYGPGQLANMPPYSLLHPAPIAADRLDVLAELLLQLVEHAAAVQCHADEHRDGNEV